MADTRILHKRGSHGSRVTALSHLEYRVWTQYLLSADDYGVMRASPSVLQADNPNLEREPVRRLQAAMDAVESSGLVQSFTHQGAKFWWQLDWQDFQGIRYPRDTVNPKPSQELIAKASDKTQKLFGIRSESARKDFGKVSETSPTPAGAGGRETLTPTLTPALERSGSSEKSTRETKPQPLIDGRAMRAHGEHAWCYYERDGFCVPPGLHRELVGKLGTATADADLRAWYQRVVASYAGVSVGDDLFRFWRNEFGRWVGTVTSAPSQKHTDKAERVMGHAERLIAKQLEHGKVIGGN